MQITRLFAVNAIVRFCSAASGQLFAFLLAQRFAERVLTGAWIVGVLGASFFVTELIAAPLAGRIADRLGPRRVLRWGPQFGAFAALIVAPTALSRTEFTPFVFILCVARIVEGIGASCAVPSTLILLARATEGAPSRRTRIMGLFEVSSLVSMIAGYVGAGIGWDIGGAYAFSLLPVLYAAGWLLIGPNQRSDNAPEQPAKSKEVQLRLFVKEPNNIAFGVAWLCVNAVVGVWFQQAPYLLKLPERSATQALVGGFTGGEIGLIFAAWGGTFLVGILLWSFGGAHIKRRTTLAIALVGMLGVVLSLALANAGVGIWVLFLAGFFVVVEAGFTPAALAHLADITQKHDNARGSALGLYSLVLGTGQLLGSIIGSPCAAHWQMNGVLALTAVLAVISLGAVQLISIE